MQVEVVGEVIGLIEVLADNYVGQWWASFDFFSDLILDQFLLHPSACEFVSIENEPPYRPRITCGKKTSQLMMIMNDEMVEREQPPSEPWATNVRSAVCSSINNLPDKVTLMIRDKS